MSIISKATEYIALKDRIKKEVLRRKHTGSVASYGGSDYDYSVVPKIGEPVLAEHYNKINIPASAINKEGLLPNVVVKDAIRGIDILDAKVTVFESSKLNSNSSSTSCSASCTGLCSSACSSGCTGCTSCSGDCYGCSGSCGGMSCSGSCSFGCGSACSSGCSGDCSSNCSDACSGCGNGCGSGCGGCSASCTANCQTDCISSSQWLGRG